MVSYDCVYLCFYWDFSYAGWIDGRPGQFLRFQDDHVFIEGLQHGVIKTSATIQEALLAKVKEKKF